MEIIRLKAPEIFSFTSTIFSHGWVDLPPFEYDRREGLLKYYILENPERETDIAIKFHKRNYLEIIFSNRQQRAIEKIVSRILFLDAEFSEFYRLIEKIPRHRWIIDKAAGRLLRCGSLWEDMVKMICTTNCNWAMTRKMITNLIEKLSPGKSFPLPEMVAGCSEAFLREDVRLGYRSGYILKLARDITSGAIDLASFENSADDETVLYRRLLKINGIGPYAAGNLLKLLGYYLHPAPDSWSRKKFMQIYGLKELPTDADIIKQYKEYGAWAGLIFWLEMTKEWYVKAIF